MDRIINWFLLVIIFVFDPLAISLVIAANVAFAQLRKTPIDELTEEDKEWLEADLIEDEEPKQTGIPVMVDPKTGKFYYEEPEENIYGEDENFPLDETDNDLVLNKHTESVENMRKIVESYDNLQNIADFTQYNYAKDALINDINKHNNTLNKDDDTITYF
jgi:hypothetical protein